MFSVIWFKPGFADMSSSILVECVLITDWSDLTDKRYVKQHNGKTEQCQLMKLEKKIFMKLFIWKEFKNIVCICNEYVY